MVEWLGNWLDLIKLVGTVLTLILAFAASLAAQSGNEIAAKLEWWSRSRSRVREVK